MAKLSDEIIISVLNLERKLLNGINEAKAIDLEILTVVFVVCYLAET
jgi:hypothetical protein